MARSRKCSVRREVESAKTVEKSSPTFSAPTRLSEAQSAEKAQVREALQQIPAEQRIVIELAFWVGLSQHEIDVSCHSPLGTIKTRWRLGMQRLKRLLHESN